MIPDCPSYLQTLSQWLLTEATPALPQAWQQGAAMRHGLLVQAVITEFDRAAARHVEENRALRALFGKALGLAGDAVAGVASPAAEEPVSRAMPQDLLAALAQATKSEDTDWRVSALQEGNRALRALLEPLHAWVEGVGTPEARALEEAIWAELLASTERRLLPLGRF